MALLRKETADMPVKFRRVLIADERYESAGFMDVDNDGIVDIVSGAYWYPGPDFTRKYIVGEVRAEGEYFDDFSTIPLDVNGDGRMDFVTGGWWGNTLRWRENPPRPGNSHPTSAPSTLFETKTDPIFVALGNDRLFGRFCRNVLNRPDIFKDLRFANRQVRAANRTELYALLADIFASDTRENWLVKMRALPAGPVRTVGEALESEEVAARGMVRTVDHPSAGPLRVIGSPYRFSKTPVVEPVAPPLLGADTEVVLTDMLGYDEAKIAELREKKIIDPL